MLRGLLSILYFALIASYALFGYFDAISTSLCLETRPGSLLSDEIFDNNFQITLLNGDIIESNTTNLILMNKFGTSKMLESYNQVVLIDSIYHNLTCLRSKIDIFFSPAGGIPTRNYTQLKSGFLSEDYSNNEFTYKCRYSSHNEDCSIKPRTKKVFLIITCIIITLMAFVFFISSKIFQFYYVRYFVQNCILLLGMDVPDTHTSCNPLTKISHYLYKGSNIAKLSNQIDINLHEKDIYVKDGVCILLIEDKAYFNIHNSFQSFDVNQHTKSELGKVLHLIDDDPRLWPMDVHESHYYSVSELISKISLGAFVSITNKRASGLVNNDETLVNFIKSGLEIKKSACRALVHHNKEFFSKTNGNIIAMQVAISGKTSWYNKPKSIGNKQWKLYSSDISQFFEHLHIGRIFVQGKYVLTNSMVKTIEKFDEGLFDRANEVDDCPTLGEANINITNYEVASRAKELIARHDKLLRNNVESLKKIVNQAPNENLTKIADIVADSAKISIVDAIADDPFIKLRSGINSVKTYAEALKSDDDASFDEEKLRDLSKQLRVKQRLSGLLDRVDRIKREGKPSPSASDYKMMYDAKSKCGAKYDKLPLPEFLNILDEVMEEHEDETKLIDDEYFIMVTKKKKHKSMLEDPGSSKPMSLLELKTHMNKMKDNVELMIENRFEFQNRFEVLKMKSEEEIRKILGVDILKCMTKWHPQHGVLHIKGNNDFQITESKRSATNGKTGRRRRAGKSKNSKKVKSKILLKKFTMNIDNTDIKEVLDNINILGEIQSGKTGADILQSMARDESKRKLVFKKPSSNKLFHEVLNYKINKSSSCDISRYINFVERHVNHFKETERYKELLFKKAELLREWSEIMKI